MISLRVTWPVLAVFSRIIVLALMGLATLSMLLAKGIRGLRVKRTV